MDDVRLIQTNSASEIFEQMIRINEKDVIIGISFPRYSMHTLKAMEFANNRNAKVITLTDSIHSPMNLYSLMQSDRQKRYGVDCGFSGCASERDQCTGRRALYEKQQEVVDTLESMEKIWDEYKVYSSDEINSIDDSVKLSFAGLGEDDV